MTNPFAETNARAQEAPAPGGPAPRDSAARAKARQTLNMEDAENWESTITIGHQMAFHWLRNDEDMSFGLVSCYVNGEPGALIVAAKPTHSTKRIEIMPLFVALTNGMRITAPDGEVIYENGGVA